jgi:hypothetical protein
MVLCLDGRRPTASHALAQGMMQIDALDSQKVVRGLSPRLLTSGHGPGYATCPCGLRTRPGLNCFGHQQTCLDIAITFTSRSCRMQYRRVQAEGLMFQAAVRELP